MTPSRMAEDFLRDRACPPPARRGEGVDGFCAFCSTSLIPSPQRSTQTRGAVAWTVVQHLEGAGPSVFPWESCPRVCRRRRRESVAHTWTVHGVGLGLECLSESLPFLSQIPLPHPPPTSWSPLPTMWLLGPRVEFVAGFRPTWMGHKMEMQKVDEASC